MKLGFFPYNTVASGKEKDVWLMLAQVIICVSLSYMKGMVILLRRYLISPVLPRKAETMMTT